MAPTDDLARKHTSKKLRKPTPQTTRFHRDKNNSDESSVSLEEYPLKGQVNPREKIPQVEKKISEQVIHPKTTPRSKNLSTLRPYLPYLSEEDGEDDDDEEYEGKDIIKGESSLKEEENAIGGE